LNPKYPSGHFNYKLSRRAALATKPLKKHIPKL
jgi:hypothetical protein